MNTTFIHTADWQLGKPFASVRDDSKRNRLREERLAVIERIGRVAREAGASFIVVAGDLFDSSTVTRAVVSRACGAIGAIGLPVLVIPGNHDHGGPGSVWEQAFFLGEQAQLAPNLRVLLNAEPIELDDVTIFPCPLLRRHESTDPTAWVSSCLEAGDSFGTKPRVVLAHGSVQGFGSTTDGDEDGGFPNLIDLARLESLPLDYVALGDWHGLKSVGARSWYSGTPELDRYPRGDDHRQGCVLSVTVERDGVPIVETVPTAAIRWHQVGLAIEGEGALVQLDERLMEIAQGRPDQALVRLELTGALGIENMRQLDARLEAWEARFLDLRLDNLTSMEPTPSEIEGLTQRVGDPLISRVATELITRVDHGGDEGSAAMSALRTLYALCVPNDARASR